MDGLDFVDVPYLDEILNNLPISASDKEDVDAYLNNIVNLVNINYKYEQYQFAYFGLHLLYMTYIYFAIWKTSKANPTRYEDVVVFARPYHGNKLDFLNIESIFEYSYVPEKDIPKIFKIIGLDGGQIGIIQGLVDTRNDMAHASGKFEILNEDAFSLSANSMFASIRNIHNCMKKQVRNLFKDFLLKAVNSDFDGKASAKELIFEQLIQNLNLSVNEVLECNEMSLNPLSIEYPTHADKFVTLKSALKSLCEERGYV